MHPPAPPTTSIPDTTEQRSELIRFSLCLNHLFNFQVFFRINTELQKTTESAEKHPLKDVYVLTPRTCEYVTTFKWQKGLCRCDEVRLLRRGITLGYLGGPGVITRVLTNRRRKGQT